MLDVKKWIAKVTQSIVTLQNSIINLNKIGTVVSDSATSISVPTGTYKNVASVTLDAGTWLVIGLIRYNNNKTGRRYAQIGTNSASANTIFTSVNGVDGGSTSVQVSYIWTLTSETTEYLVAYQASGSNLTVSSAYLTAVRLK